MDQHVAVGVLCPLLQCVFYYKKKSVKLAVPLHFGYDL